MDIDELYRLYLEFPLVETDTRKIRKGALFFALKGPNFNGNHYAQQALDAGAAYCIVDEPPAMENEKMIVVADSLNSLQQLAKKHRDQFTIPFLAITGSNGKTTTKELIHAVLSAKFKTYTTEGNLNNHIGIPLTILKIKKDAEMAVIEMGANHLNEIREYCRYTNPTHGLITNTGKAHIEGFGSEEGVRKAKGELFDHLAAHHGTAFVFNDHAHLNKMSAGINHVITYGTANADQVGNIASQAALLEVKMDNDLLISTKLVGGYNLPNVLAAVCVGRTFGITDEKIKAALESYTPSNSRSQLIQKDGNYIILDAYNANPSSMKAAIENFARMPGDKKMLVLGGMMELGKDSVAEHSEIVQLIGSHKWLHVVLVGKDYVDLPAHMIHFATSTEAREWLRSQDLHDTHILVKGSRSIQMEKVLE
jgi:UDP-N-acetylmuramoyl-tripeptide--D-alanyl-D-alanine ligase